MKDSWCSFSKAVPQIYGTVLIYSFLFIGSFCDSFVTPILGYDQELLQVVKVKKIPCLAAEHIALRTEAGWETGTAGETPADLAGLWPPSGHFHHWMSRRTSSYWMLWLKKAAAGRAHLAPHWWEVVNHREACEKRIHISQSSPWCFPPGMLADKHSHQAHCQLLWCGMAMLKNALNLI